MNSNESLEVEKTLQKPGIHQEWENAYRMAENNRYYDLAIGYIAGLFNTPDDSLLLDAGCGIGDYSIRLSRHGFKVVAVDFSESVLENAAKNIQQSGVGEKIRLQRENLLSLSFTDRSFDYIICWGVLMHIPEVERAISELSRVVKNGGSIVISEANMYSPEAVAMRTVKRLLGRQKEEVIRTPAGIEYWWTSGSDRLLTREANIRWLKEAFKKNGFRVRKHIAGQFTELYTKVSSRPIRNLLHRLNRAWFRHIRSPRFAFGNIIIFEKEGGRETGSRLPATRCG